MFYPYFLRSYDILTNVAGGGAVCNGGGIYVWSSTPTTITHNLIQSNRALDGTGSAGYASHGGGVHYAGKPIVTAVIRDNVLRFNIAATDWIGEGGGLYLSGVISPAIVSSNTLEGNVASFNDDGMGGGIYLDASVTTVKNNSIFGNTASPGGSLGIGGGVFVNEGTAWIVSNVITTNRALVGAAGGDGWGGGLALSNTLAFVQDNYIAKNSTSSAPNSSGGGGGLVARLGTLQIVGNDILSNTAGIAGGNDGRGGGLHLEQANAHLEGNTILGNYALGTHGVGGGVRLENCAAVTLTNNIVAHNEASERGSGIEIRSSAGRLAHNTLHGNTGGDGAGVRVDGNSSVTLINNIIASQTVGISNATPASSTVLAQYTLFDGNGLNYGAGVTSANPLPGPAALLANYHLRSGSGAIDQALPLAWVTKDIDGEPRPHGAAPDVGADEWRPRMIYLPIILRQ